MSSNHHTPIAVGASANAATFNLPLGELDAAIDAVASDLGALDTRVDGIVASTGDDITEVVDARDGETVLNARLDKMDAAIQDTATALDANASVGATTVVLRKWNASIASGVWIVIDAFTSECEVRRVLSVSGTTITFVSVLAYAHSAGDNVLISYAGEINALWFGASPSASAAANGLAFARMVAQAKRNDNPTKMYIPGASDPYEFDTPIVLASTGAIYGLAIRGDGMARRGEIYTHGTVLYYTPGDATNAIEIGDGTNACRNLSLADLTLRCNRAGGHTGCGILARYVGYTSDMLRNVAVTLAYIGIRTQDCWGSTWRNVDVSFCDLGASINASNAGAWIGGGARSCYGAVAVSLCDANSAESTNQLISYRMSDLAFEGNAADSLWLTRTSTIATATVYYGITLDNLYFEANGGTYDIQIGHGHDTAAVSFTGLTVRNCKFEDNILIGRNVRGFVIGPNRFNDAAKGIRLESASGEAHGVIVGASPSVIKTALDAYIGSTYTIGFQDGRYGVISLGITGVGSSYNWHSKLYTPLVTAAAIGTTVATADWRALAGATLIKITHTSATNFTEITNVPDHTLLMLKFENGNTTVVHNASKISLRGAANWNPAAGDVLTLISDGGVLYEVSRSQ